MKDTIKPAIENPIAVLCNAAMEIVHGTREVFAEHGQVGGEIRLPILIHGTDMRVTIQAGPRVAARNAIEHAKLKASGKATEPVVNTTEVLQTAQRLLAMFATDLDATRSKMPEGGPEWHRAKDEAKRCHEIISELEQVGRLL